MEKLPGQVLGLVIAISIMLAGFGMMRQVGEGAVTQADLAAYVKSPVVNADVSATAAIAPSKLGAGAAPAGFTVNSGNITDGTIITTDINANAGIVRGQLDSTTRPVKPVTLVICPSNSSNTTQCDYLLPGTNDHTLFAAALAALPAQGGNIYVADGLVTFGASVAVPTGTHLYCVGIGDSLTNPTKITLANGVNGHVFTIGSGVADPPTNDISFTGCTVDGNGANQVGTWDDFYITNSRNISFDKMRIVNAARAGIYQLGREWINVRDSYIFSNLTGGIYIDGGNFDFIRGNQFSFNGPTGGCGAGYAIQVKPSNGGGGRAAATQVFLANNNFEETYCGPHLLFDGTASAIAEPITGWTIQGNTSTMYRAIENARVTTSSAGMIWNNVSYMRSQGNYWGEALQYAGSAHPEWAGNWAECVRILGGSHDNTVSDTCIDPSTAGVGSYAGISIDGGSVRNTVSQAAIRDDRTTAYMTTAVTLSATSTANIVKDNQLSRADGKQAAVTDSGSNNRVSDNKGYVDVREIRGALAQLQQIFGATSTVEIWPFFEQSGTTVADYGGGGLTLNATHGDDTAFDLSSWATKPVYLGKASHYTFDGSNNGLSMADTDSLSLGDGNNDVAFTMMFSGNVTNTASDKVIAGRWTTHAGAGREWDWRFRGTNNHLLFRKADESANDFCNWETNAIAPIGAEHVYAVTSSSLTINNCAGITLYSDGVVLASTAANCGGCVAMENLALKTRVGAEGTGADTGITAAYQGTMSWMMIAKGKALSANEVLAATNIMNALLER